MTIGCNALDDGDELEVTAVFLVLRVVIAGEEISLVCDLLTSTQLTTLLIHIPDVFAFKTIALECAGKLFEMVLDRLAIESMCARRIEASRTAYLQFRVSLFEGFCCSRHDQALFFLYFYYFISLYNGLVLYAR